MLPNSNNLICGDNNTHLKPFSELIQLQTVPFSFKKTQNGVFYYCNVKDNMITNLIQGRVENQGQITSKQLEEFMGNYQYQCFSDDHLFLINTEGDVTLYNYHSKESYFLQKQHPSNFSPIQLHNIDSIFVTCGGNVKTGIKTQKIIKVWQQKEGQIVNHSRIVIGHTKPVENSFILGRNKVISLSTDRTIRCTNLATQEIESTTHVKADYYSGFGLDWNTALVAGTSKSIDIFDSRTPKIAFSKQIDLPIIQICEITRLGASNFLLANVNQILQLDMRNMSVNKLGLYEGERITDFTPINEQSLVIGNRDKNFQIWTFY